MGLDCGGARGLPLLGAKRPGMFHVVIVVVAAGYECRPEGRRKYGKRNNVVDGGGYQRKIQ
jgi:hypothetical protein